MVAEFSVQFPGRSKHLFARRYGWAGALSLALHAVCVLLVMGLAVRTPTITAPIRVFLRDVAPPPPPPAAVAAAPISASSQPEAPVVPQPQVVPRPHLAKRAPRHAAPRPASPPTAVAASEAREPAPVAAAAESGQANGVPGGVAGGLPGGIVGGTGHTVLSANEAARSLIPISRVLPEYPPLARSRGIEGQVVLQAILDLDGRIEPEIAVVHSVPMLDAAAIAAVRQWRFQPAHDPAGAPLRVAFRVPIRFVLR